MGLETTSESPAPVRQIANAIAQWIDRLGTVWVEGQVAQMSRRQGMNTVFLTLRDPVADVSVPVTCSRQLFDSLNPPLVEGARVVVHAKPSYYANRGTLSLRANDIRMVGLGELLARIERRRQLLAAEGLFAQERKRPLPFLPRCVGLITGGGSAAERDVLEVARRRWPAVQFRVVHTAVQGTQAAGEVMQALGRLDRDDEVDVIVIARGGGSVEDLLPFSDEGLLRAVFAARTPVVSAIGHEPDSPLLDLVADRRAATPTDAAKTVVPDVAEETDRIQHARVRLRHVLTAWVAREQHALDTLRARPALADPASGLADRLDEVHLLRDRVRRSLRHRIERADDDLEHRLARVRALSPLATLSRGYAVVQDADGHVVTSPAQTAAGAALTIRVADGRIGAEVTDTHHEPTDPPDATRGASR
ncbi:exodeoxyribonuclease VII large subunit [Nocardioides iriomotensis]|uniref:Exodeoxyribonuclease 7 large subunit n=1 Tax=Nocardioides iriomotensis TaxID=715784 RepID=A0A4Q5J8T0_9ACTN|nr:exodeoxyribonuclease VII large subunit [Nocardioides iriomotensis]RYU14191.1 exodeoxyribonuclease VII large subunit [Nocardioides iriomotensis]